MQLMTEELQRTFPKIGQTDGTDAKVIAVYFTPDSNWTWYATEYDPEERVFFGLVKGFETELGYFSLDELESVRGPAGLPIERDLYFKSVPLSEIKQTLNA
jgi:hypothetical protein